MQSLKSNYFQLFNLPQSCEIDQEALNDEYRKQQGEVHPDRFANAEEHEKLRALQLSSYLNEAYETIKSPLRRAAYLLALHDIDVEKVDQNDLSMDLLLEQIQLREKLDELPKDESALADLDMLRAEVISKLERQENRFAEFFVVANYEDAKKVYHELQFLNKLRNEIDAGEELRLGY
ncbi:MAG: Fe-S protein assembly co-chaperone HscB [SAR86 cluster bacterium]|uniref:Co-chaperone protein HscB homolog n=1 Tax=SAR86 cluster bacterium TaxID=2030880 RepID=A0A2A4XFM8_9GAMM|nr:MAG: Fe-S protein assembly co-chaperone HscB [SAR86 cluster bacterium]